MPDTFHVHGNEIHYGPYRVGFLAANLPATVEEEVIQALEFMVGRDEEIKRMEKEYEQEIGSIEKAHAKELAEAQQEIDDLTAKIKGILKV